MKTNNRQTRAFSIIRMKPECIAAIRDCMSNKSCVPGMNRAIAVLQGYIIKHCTDTGAITGYRDAIKYEIWLTNRDNPKSSLIVGLIEAKVAVRDLLEKTTAKIERLK